MISSINNHGSEGLSNYLLLENTNLLKSAKSLLKSRKNDTKTAMLFKTFLQTNPDNIEALNGYGRVLLYLKKHQESLNAFEKTLTIDKTDGEALQHSGYVWYVLGKEEKSLQKKERSLERFEEAEKIGKLSPFFFRCYAGFLYKMKKFEKAEKAYEIITENSQMESDWETYKEILTALGKTKKAKLVSIIIEQLEQQTLNLVNKILQRECQQNK